MLGRCGSELNNEIHQTVSADVAQTRGKQDRKDFVLANGIMQSRDQVLLRNRALVEELLH